MALTRKLTSVTMPALADLSAGQFRGVYVDDNGRVDFHAGGTVTPFVGILLNKPSAIDQAAEVAIDSSIVKMVAGGTVAERDMITGLSTAGMLGKGVATTTANTQIVGQALSSAASGELFELLVNPGRYSAA